MMTQQIENTKTHYPIYLLNPSRMLDLMNLLKLPNTHSHFFETLKSNRRLDLVKEVNAQVATSMPTHVDCRIDELEDLAKVDIYAGDGHYHQTSKEQNRSFAPMYLNPLKRSQLTLKFIRWLRHHIDANSTMQKAVDSLTRVYALF